MKKLIEEMRAEVALQHWEVGIVQSICHTLVYIMNILVNFLNVPKH